LDAEGIVTWGWGNFIWSGCDDSKIYVISYKDSFFYVIFFSDILFIGIVISYLFLISISWLF